MDNQSGLFKHLNSIFKAEGNGSIRQKLARFVLRYRTAPNSTTNQTPAELFLKRKPRTRMDLLRPNLSRTTSNKQADQKAKYDKHSKERTFEIGETVLVQNFRGETKWLTAKVVEQTGPVSYKVQIGEGVHKRHADQMHKTSSNVKSEMSQDGDSAFDYSFDKREEENV